MRDIKFRAWDGRSMQFGGFSIHATGKLEPCQGLSRLKGDSIIMQFTGLTDKNGTEIYEGDILSMWYAPRATCKGDVRFADGSFNFYTTQAGPGKSHLIDLTKEYHNEIEVIGNVHQNQELLENKQ